ncbi:hypothetical protein GCM10009841_04240 [Microlunatus panaciterrae]|uniref:SURF1-like protein n=1 Tax=Microlunatus panaciterrae TaxID=400768 RepID=A0ABS2RIW5_9ACTN|nr:SURF1 family cytochrome oxidase biogenesis protein [Microlunatus panaciterrae]MBM7798917.1 cytochrome oxidase assembly protein ShyY1 [Microlunatus panaciterrae]
MSGLRLKQAAIVLVGLVAAAVMVLLGVWQLNVYTAQSADSAASRAAAPAVPLAQVARAGDAVVDGYGRTVHFSGNYDPALQLLVPVPGQAGRFRVLSGLQQGDGSVVPVVRGVVDGTHAPAAPTGPLEQSGVLLPSEAENTAEVPTGQLASVRLATLAQLWTKPLVNGFVTLSATQARAQGLQPATAALPEGHGRLRNGAYAFQWWIFAAFAVAMAIRMARDLGSKQGYLELVEEGHATDSG